MFQIIVQNHRGISWNKFYDTPHWTQRAELAKETHWLVRAALPAEYEMFKGPVDIRVQAHYKHHPADSDNVCGKIYIDGLKGLVIEDDDPRYVRDCTTRSVTGCCDDYVVIQIMEVE